LKLGSTYLVLKESVTADHITAYLSDGRVVSVPLWWSWRLEQATNAQQANYQIIGAGYTVYWPEIDEHLSVQGFLTGTPAHAHNLKLLFAHPYIIPSFSALNLFRHDKQPAKQ
jgi:hypothetical protein